MNRLFLLFFVSLLLTNCANRIPRPTTAVAPVQVPTLPISTIQIPIAIESSKLSRLLEQQLPKPLTKGQTASFDLLVQGKAKRNVPKKWWHKLSDPVISWVNKNFAVKSVLFYEVDLSDLQLQFVGNQVIATADLAIESHLKLDRAVPFGNRIIQDNIPCPIAAQVTLGGTVSMDSIANLLIDLKEDKTNLIFKNICSNQSLDKNELPIILQSMTQPIQAALQQQINQVLTQQIRQVLVQSKQYLSFEKQLRLAAEQLNQSYLLQPDIWLQPNVEQLVIAPIVGSGEGTNNKLHLQLGLEARPNISITKNKPPENKRTVNIITKKVNNISSVFVHGKIGLDTVGQQLQSYLKEYVDTYHSKHGYTIGKVVVYPNYNQAIVAVDLLRSKNQKYKGTFYLAGIPKYNSTTQKVYLDSLAFTSRTKSVLLKSAKWLLQPTVLKQLKANAQFAIGDQLRSIQQQLNTFRIEENIGTLTGKFEVVDLVALFITAHHFEIYLQAEGQLFFDLKTLE